MTVARSVVTAVVAILVLQVPIIAAASSDGRIVAMPTREQARSRPTGGGSTNLFSHGGAVETTPAIYLSYWGTEWAASADAQSYVNGFFGSVGGSSWINSTNQYCQAVPSGTVDCATQTAAQYITNSSGQLKGTWNDTTAVPSQPSQSDIAAAAARLARRFGYDANATYFVLTPTQKSMRGFGTRWCAWHSSQTVSAGPLAYAYIPYQPDAGANCGAFLVNSAFDGFSIVGGHEYAEAQTDPFPNSGWLDGSGAENGDKCAWITSGQGAVTSITLGGGQYAVQSLWSNAFNGGKGGCVIAYP